MKLILLILIIFFIAVLFSMLGLGGAIIYTPLFFWLGLPLLSAIPMALMLNTVTTASASMTYLKQRLVETGTAFYLIITSITGAIAGSYLAGKVDTDILLLLLSAVLSFASIRVIFFSNTGFSVGIAQEKKLILCSIAGFFIGAVSSLVGVGGGTFIVPLLLLLGFETKKATATSSFIITFIALAGFLGHLTFGYEQLDFNLLLYTGAAAFIGAQAGSRVIFRRVSPVMINRMFGIVLLMVIGKLLYGLI